MTATTLLFEKREKALWKFKSSNLRITEQIGKLLVFSFPINLLQIKKKIVGA